MGMRMNPLSRHFLPSLARGVYRFDDELSEVKTEEAYQQFIEGKLRFLPFNLSPAVAALAPTKDRFEPGSRSFQFQPEVREASQRAKDFFRRHSYFANALIGDRMATEAEISNADNYLEIQFVKKVLAPLLNDDGMSAIEPQKRIGPYLIDFACQGDNRIALEVDGFGKFKSRQNLDEFTQRQNCIVGEGWQIVRYTYGQVIDRTAMTLRELHRLFALDEQLRRFLVTRQQLSLLPDPEATEASCPIVDFVNDFYLVQDALVDIATSTGRSSEKIYLYDDFGHPAPFVAAALSCLYEYLDAVSQLVDIDFDFPEVEVFHPNVRSRPAETLHAQVSESDHLAPTSERLNRIAVRRRSGLIPTPPREAGQVTFRKGLSLERINHSLAYFAKNVFRYPEGTKRFQDRIIQRMTSGNDVLGIAATGSGKSFCFWLPSLLRPGLTLIISPLRSLMRDQRLTLLNYGIASADFINSDVDSATQKRILQEAALGYVRLLYISPERLRIKKFVAELDRLHEQVPVNILAIDEAHCISEWGHDFRPSYLKLPLAHVAIKKHSSGSQLLALTATAGPQVEKDILSILHLRDGEDGDVIRERVSDRERFSYQVAEADPGESKTNRYHDLISQDLPKALRRMSLSDLLDARNTRGEKAVGIVFCIYADPHGRYSVFDGTSHYLFETKSVLEPATYIENRPKNRIRLDAFSSGRVRPYSSKEPTLCPKCHSYQYVAQSRKTSEHETDDDGDIKESASPDASGGKICIKCGHEFREKDVKSPPSWDDTIKNNQIAFKKGVLDVLVATKGFGMGIDKGSVRFVIHTSMSSGLESWYQEVGRAGRDNERAHVVLLTDPPNQDCLNALNTLEVKKPECTRFGGCPYGKVSLCDYGKQHVFITGSYPGVESDAAGVLRLLQKVHRETTLESGVISITSSNTYLSRDELAIYRLTVLGLFEDYVVTYHPNPRFEVTTAKIDLSDFSKLADVMQPKLEHYFSHFAYRRDSNVADGLARCRNEYRPFDSILDRLDPNIVTDTTTQFFHTVYEHLLLLLDHTYKFVVKMRYDMLWNLLSVVNSKECRRKAILPYFGDRLEEGYQCGCCDVCAPHLDFPEIRITPTAKASDSERERLLERLLANDIFDLVILRELADEFSEYPTTQYRRARSILEGSPNNLAALFFTREFSPREEREGNTKRLLRTANQRRVELSDLRTLYETSLTAFKPELLLLLNEPDTTCDSVAGWRFLALEAAKPGNNRNPSVTMMGEVLEFFVAVEELRLTGTSRLSDKAAELEIALNG